MASRPGAGQNNKVTMLFDDRLATVLRLGASGPAVLRIQFRQLLDLLGTCPADARGEQLDAAYIRLGELAQLIPAPERAEAIRDAGLRLRSPRLVAALACAEPAVASAALQCAQLSAEQWLDLVPALSPAARPYLRHRRDLPAEVSALLSRLGVTSLGLPAATQVAPAVFANENDPAEAPGPAGDALHPQSGIGAIVRRIEAYRRARQGGEQGGADAPRLPLGEDHVLQVSEDVRAFDFATDAECRINWSDPGVAPMVTGVRLTEVASGADFAALTRRHQPLRTEAVELIGARAIAGHWLLDAAPWFDPVTGRFLGYRGRMRRPAASGQQVEPVRESQADRMRQMLHELRTPVNAIQGFAEVIQQQLFGPTPHEYRALAAGIAGDAARILSAFDELDRLAKLDSGALEIEPGETDLAALLEATISQLSAHTAPRRSGFTLRIKDEPPHIGMDRVEAERIVWRLLATLAGVSAPEEIVRLGLEPTATGLRLDLALPTALAGKEGEDLFEAAAGSIAQSLSAGVFGVGFALRLARSEARAAGGDLVHGDGQLTLTLPAHGGATLNSNPGQQKSAH